MMRWLHKPWIQLLPVALLVTGAILLVVSVPARAAERQYKVEAAYLYSFFNYITWPGYKSPSDIAKPVICIYGDDPILPYLEYVRGKMKNERSLSLRVVIEERSVEGCHIVFMRHRALRLTSLPNDTLTVFKPDDPLDRAGMIELAEDGERIAIKVNQSQLEENGFQVSSRLLDLARGVK